MVEKSITFCSKTSEFFFIQKTKNHATSYKTFETAFVERGFI